MELKLIKMEVVDKDYKLTFERNNNNRIELVTDKKQANAFNIGGWYEVLIGDQEVHNDDEIKEDEEQYKYGKGKLYTHKSMNNPFVEYDHSVTPNKNYAIGYHNGIKFEGDDDDE